MKGFFSGSFLFLSVFCAAQDTTFETRDEYIHYIFGNISDQYLQTGFLMDRNPELSDSTWQQFKVNNSFVSQVHRINHWFGLFQYLTHAKTDEPNLPEIETVMWPLYNDIFLQVDEGSGVTLPLFILDYDVEKMVPNALEDGYLNFEDNQFSDGVNTENGFARHHLFFSGILADTIQTSHIQIELNEDFIFSNRDQTVDYVAINCNGTIDTLFPGDIMDLSSIILESNTLRIQLHYTDGEKINSMFRFYARNINAVKSTLDEQIFFDSNGSIGLNPKLYYSIKYGCNHNDLLKPVIFVAGFGMSSENIILTMVGQGDNVELYNKYNLDGLMDELLASGHDVVMVRFTPAVEDIIAGAERLIDLINIVNSQKTNNGSSVENIIVGYSAGAICVRYALDQMEYEHMENNGPHHHCKLYVSFEGEHQGANIPLGSQFMLDYLHANNNCLSTDVIHYMANSPQAKELLKYYWPHTGKMENGISFNQGQGPDGLRVTLMEDMEVVYAHNKQYEKFGYFGFPAFTRNIGIVNGSRKTGSFDGSQTINEPYNFDFGHIMFEQDNLSKYWQIKFYSHSELDNGASGPRNVYVYHETNIWGTLTYHETFRTDQNILMYDYGPGGFLEGGDDMLLKVMNKAGGFCNDGCLEGSPEIYEFRTTSFTPVVSCLDIRNFYPTTRQLHWDLQEQNLMRIGFDGLGVPIISDFFGYPVLGYPTNHFSITPFEAIYADEFNETHIGSFSTSATNGAYPEFGTLSNQNHMFINDFLFTEIMYKKLYLQNRQVGWNTNGVDYTAEFETQDEIIIGAEVTAQTDVAPFEVLVNGNVVCHAGTGISIKPGFHAKSGSGFHAYIEVPLCTYSGGGPSTKVLSTGYQAQQSGADVASATAQLKQEPVADFKLVPNPNNGNFYIDLGSFTGSVFLEIIDLSGKIKYTGRVANTESLNLTLEKGIYVVRVLVDNHYLQQKLVIQ